MFIKLIIFAAIIFVPILSAFLVSRAVLSIKTGAIRGFVALILTIIVSLVFVGIAWGVFNRLGILPFEEVAIVPLSLVSFFVGIPFALYFALLRPPKK